ncbi:CCA tRNA nucleotidyltransferase [Haliovirga abyssi]|uniref:Polynucleotide adenylyltransferase n=1 Tax=Haliovirga abyssi TaxID=2996794 RepID=A0AAU9DCH3_9FUSO|nr:HD domain-containing protein [Haliovirga abyssi]BDU49997.1 polynucleotide adenylyltransferase [Haliovirga abyssi]
MININLDKKLINMFNEIIKNGGKPYICGGYIRDYILNIKNKDIDIEVFNVEFQKLYDILNKFGKARIVGESYKIILIGDYEFSVPKENLDIKSAGRRRDFTMNSIYYDFESKKIIDFFNGIEDIKNGIIRLVDDKNIDDDPLRILRIAQFLARLNFKVDEKTEKIAIKNREKILNIAKERIFIEFEKILLKAKKPSLAFQWMKKIGLLKLLFPELDRLSEIEQGDKFHPEGDAFTHTMLTLDVLEINERNIEVMLAILFHDIGKAIVKTNKIGNHITFYRHEIEGAKLSKKSIKKMTSSKELAKNVFSLIKYHMVPFNFSKSINRKTIKKLSVKVDFLNLMLLHKADYLGRKNIDENILYVKESIEIYENIKEETKPIIKGKDVIKLGIKPGPEIGKILKLIYIAQLEEKFSDYESGIKYLENYISKWNKNINKEM